MEDRCKHKYQGDNLYCRLCHSLSEQRAGIFIAEVLRMREMTATLTFGADGNVTITVAKKSALAKVADFRAHIETKIKRTRLEVIDATS